MKKSLKKGERELLEKTAQIYQSVTRDSMDGFWIVDMQGRFMDVNESYISLIGYSRKELLKMNVSDVESGDKADGVVKHLQEIKKTGAGRFLTQHLKKDGTIIDIEATANYADYLGGFIFIFIRDISEQKKREEKLSRNRVSSKKIIVDQLADSYKHSEEQAESKKALEGQLADSYKHSEEQAESKKVLEGQLADSYKHSEDQAESKKVLEGQLADSYKHSEEQAESKKALEGQLADSYKHSEERATSRKVIEGQLADSYKHSKERATSRKVIEGQLADSYKHSKERATSRKVIEGQLADSYKHSEERATSRKVIEGQLADSYKYQGKINRKISLLLELERFPQSKKHKQEIIDHVLTLAMSILSAQTGYLYSSEKRGSFDLLSYKGIKEEQKEKIKVITTRTVGFLRHLMKEKGLISGDIKRYEAELLVLDNKLEYFVTLPLSKGSVLGGFIFLGFDKKKSVETQDLEFMDVFAMHASNALAKAGVLK